MKNYLVSAMSDELYTQPNAPLQPCRADREKANQQPRRGQKKERPTPWLLRLLVDKCMGKELRK